MFTYSEVRVDVSEHTKLLVFVPPWEVPLIEAVHGHEKCEVVGERLVRRSLPDAGAEFDRLITRYGIDTDNGQPLVALVYGGGSVGIGRLKDAIDKVQEIEVKEHDLVSTSDEPEEIEV
jgi:hypothetical protein